MYYLSYGLCIESSWPLPLPKITECNSASIELIEAPAAFFLEAVRDFTDKIDGSRWFYHFRLADGSDYILWTGMFEFIVSTDGKQIWGHALPAGSLERLQTYLLGQAISFSLVKQGTEPLHSTAIIMNGEAVAFLGNSGYGKSTLGAAFLQAGFMLLTDDLLVIDSVEKVFVAHPGPQRVKLFPEVAKVLLDNNISGSTMNPGTTKLVLPLSVEQSSQGAVTIRKIYVLQPPDLESPCKSITIDPLSKRQACVKLIENTFNTVLMGPDRQTQLLKSASKLAAGLTIQSLSYPRDLSRITEVVEMVRSDFA